MLKGLLIAATTAFASGQALAQHAGPDALLTIDQHRATVVDRIVGEWGDKLAHSSAGLSQDHLRSMLEGLRADHLLAASLAGSLAGLRDVLAGSLTSATGPGGKTGAVVAKTVGDVSDDVVYTPVTPCRLVETRTVYEGVYHAGGPFAGGEIRDYQVQGGNGVCLSQLPAGLNPAAVQLQVFGIPINGNSNGDVEILPQGSTFGNTSTQVYVGNVLINTVSTTAKINVTNNQISVQIRGGGAHLALDVVGYFKRPANYGGTHSVTGLYATDSGGENNTASGLDSTVAGGISNSAGGKWSSVSGGIANHATGIASAVGGGDTNLAFGDDSTVPGGYSNSAVGKGSFAAGQFASANGDGCVVFGDNSTGNAVTCPRSPGTANQFVARAVGGVYFFSGGTSDASYSGVSLLPGAGAWTAYSDRNGKDNIRAVDPMAVLKRLVSLPIGTWNWTSQDAGIRHMGPMAQDFSQAFSLGETEHGISTVDADGVAFAAIQGLHLMMQQKNREIARLQARASKVDELERKLDALEARLGPK